MTTGEVVMGALICFAFLLWLVDGSGGDRTGYKSQVSELPEEDPREDRKE